MPPLESPMDATRRSARTPASALLAVVVLVAAHAVAGERYWVLDRVGSGEGGSRVPTLFTDASVENAAHELSGAALVVRCVGGRARGEARPLPLIVMQSDPAAFLGLEGDRVQVSAVIDGGPARPLGAWRATSRRSYLRGYDHALLPPGMPRGEAGCGARAPAWSGLFEAMSGGGDLDLYFGDGERRAGRFLLLLRGFAERFDDLAAACESGRLELPDPPPGTDQPAW